MTLWTKLRPGKPFHRKFIPAIRHVLAAENPEFQHFRGGEFRSKIRGEVLADRFSQQVRIVCLHQIVDLYASFSHVIYRMTNCFPTRARPGLMFLPVWIKGLDQFSTAPSSIQSRMVSTSAALSGSLPCGMVTVRFPLPATMLYSELVVAEPGLTTAPNRVPFITDS